MFSLIPRGVISGSKCTSLLSIHISNPLSRKGKHFNSPSLFGGLSVLPRLQQHTGSQSQSKSPQDTITERTFLCHFHHCFHSLLVCSTLASQINCILFLCLWNLHLYLHELYKHEEWPFGCNSWRKDVFRCQMEIRVHQKHGFSRTRMCRHPRAVFLTAPARPPGWHCPQSGGPSCLCLGWSPRMPTITDWHPPEPLASSSQETFPNKSFWTYYGQLKQNSQVCNLH